MMFQKLTISLAIFSALQGQAELLFDGAGQMGIYSEKGIVAWNRDIFSGPILIDGTFNYFPQKYGKNFFNSLQIDYESATAVIIEPDTARFTTDMDYQMGDYDLDQLDIEGKYLSGNSQLRLVGFKRSFSGNGFPAQYIRNDGLNIPLQQTYLAEYASETAARNVKAAFLLLNGNYNLIAGDFNNYGQVEDRITAGGVHITRRLKRSAVKLGVSQYHQRYDPSMPFFPTRTKVRLNRQFLTLGIDSLHLGPFSLFTTANYHSQGVRQSGQNSNIRNWVNISGGFHNSNMNASLGGIIAGDIFLPEGRLAAHGQLGKFNGSTSFEFSHKPSHAMISSADDWERWLRAELGLSWKPGLVTFGGIIYYTGVENARILDFNNANWLPVEIDASSVNTSFYGSLGIIGSLTIGIRWDHANNKSWLSDGIGDRIRTDISFSQDIKFLAVTVRGELGWEEYFNRHDSIGFDPHWGIPYQNGPTPGYNTSANFLTGRISVEISSMTIYGSLQNIPNYLGNNLSFVDVENTWVQNNAYIPPMGKMAVIGIRWRFLN